MLAASVTPSRRGQQGFGTDEQRNGADVVGTSVGGSVELLAPSVKGAGEARAVNAEGDVAGRFNDAAFIWHAGQFTSYPAVRSFYLGDSYASIAKAINRFGTAAGHDGEYKPCSMSGLELASAVTVAAGKIHFIDRSRDGQCSFEADGINDRGIIVGESGYRGFVRSADGHEIEVHPLCTRPENKGTRASAIDNDGHVVGGTTIDVANVPLVKVGERPPYGGMAEPIYAPDASAYVIHAYLLTLAGDRQRMRDLGAIHTIRIHTRRNSTKISPSSDTRARNRDRSGRKSADGAMPGFGSAVE